MARKSMKLRVLTKLEMTQTSDEDGEWYNSAEMEVVGGTVVLFAPDGESIPYRAMAIFNGRGSGWKTEMGYSENLGEFPADTDYYDCLRFLVEWASKCQ